MRAVIPLSDHPYYLWQLLVQAQHFSKIGQDAVFLTYGPSDARSPLLDEIEDSIPFEIMHWREPAQHLRRGYNASMKPWLLGRYFEQRPAEVSRELLYLDPDVMFAGLDAPMPGAWHASDTDSYTGPGYLDSKNALAALCALVDVDVDRARAFPGVGAQYVISGADSSFWLTVAGKSIDAYSLMTSQSRRFKRDGDEYPVQAWCAEMYVTQLLAIKHGFEPTLDASMSFLWASGNVSEWEQHRFFHNAGVPVDNGRDFCKCSWQHSPFWHSLSVDSESASSKYVELIRRTEQAHPELTKKWR